MDLKRLSRDLRASSVSAWPSSCDPRSRGSEVVAAMVEQGACQSTLLASIG